MALHGAPGGEVAMRQVATRCDTLCAALSLRQFGNSTRCFARSASLQSLASQLPQQESEGLGSALVI